MPIGRRAQQWTSFARIWHILNAYQQNPGQIATVACKYLEGRNKAIYHPGSNVGDHVIIVNTKEIAYSGNKWEQKVFTEHSGRPKGFLQLQAYKVHELDPTWIVRKSIYRQLTKKEVRRCLMQRLHVFPDENVPEELLVNVSNVITPPRRIPKSIYDYSEEEIKEFPKLWIPPEDFLKT